MNAVRILLTFLLVCCLIKPGFALQAKGDPPRKKKVYVTWVYVQRLDSATGVMHHEGRFKGLLVGLSDSTLLLDTRRPYIDWAPGDGGYVVPYTDIRQIAVRKKRSPLVYVGGFYGGAIAGGLIGANTVDKKQFALVQLFLIAGIMAVAGTVTLLVLLFKKKFQVNGKREVFAGLRSTLERYLQ
ncbi:MAG: hypothetical protein IPL65_16430 [Lewinellaceae bacterium]|nr:hypothetical protein [Lewinellaceae bacterium]